MSQSLKLYNSFTRATNIIKLAGKPVQANRAHGKPIYGSLYICGPTVYSDSHLGHAITYIRADLIRRFMASLFNVKLFTVMNITDIDDKILERTRELYSDKSVMTGTDPLRHPFSKVGDQYFNAFVSDMSSVKVLPADLYVRVSKSVDLIVQFIRNLEKLGHAYTTDDGDVLFNVRSVENYVGIDVWSENDDNARTRDQLAKKNDPKDFVLWKAAKPGEPVWNYKSFFNDTIFPGRPGWHVQCSAISSAIFGNQLDFHFGGKDLKFPHHYNEEACCCAFHQLDTSKSLHVWSKNWLHFGHLVLQDKKMSKSLGNVVPIKKFVDRASVNALRLLCIVEHYRADITFDDNLNDKVKSIDHKINAFISYLADALSDFQGDVKSLSSHRPENGDVQMAIDSTYKAITDGVCDDFHLDVGLDSILQLAKLIYSKGKDNLTPIDLVAAWHLVDDWCSMCSLEYGHLERWRLVNQLDASSLLQDFRKKIRQTTLEHMKTSNPDLDPIAAKKVLCSQILSECDNIRAKMDELGFVIRDPKL